MTAGYIIPALFAFATGLSLASLWADWRSLFITEE